MAGHVNHAAISSQGDGNAWPLVEERAAVIARGRLTKDEREIPLDRVLQSIKYSLARRDALLECRHVCMSRAGTPARSQHRSDNQDTEAYVNGRDRFSSRQEQTAG